jgi:hypothetical protein
MRGPRMRVGFASVEKESHPQGVRLKIWTRTGQL